MTSERDAAGRLMSMPGIVEAAATNPIRSLGVPKLLANGLSTGLFDMVELRIANAPITHRIKNDQSLETKVFLVFIRPLSPYLSWA
jgi:hypothetical protein